MLPGDMLLLAAAVLGGGVLGVIFFGGLWWTVRVALASAQPALWHFGSVLLRTAVTLSGFHLIGVGHWQRLLACLAGFVLARIIVTRVAGARAASPAVAPEADHAPQP